jgi:drug/metabolite transporter (DMT)-like permease
VSQNTKAVLQALFVTFLWATSWVLIKKGLGSIPPLTFAGLRYGLAFVIMLPWMLRPAARTELRRLTRRQWIDLGLLGLVFITLTQGAQFVALSYLPANMLSLLLSLSALVIALLGLIFLKEHLGSLQWLGVLVSLTGAFIYFGQIGKFSMVGLAIGLVCVLATSVAAIQGRALNRLRNLAPLTVTGVSIGIGGTVLVVLGLLTEPLPRLGFNEGLVVFWLAAINTALAFVIWNHTQRTLTAAQSGVINNTMLIQIAILAWIFLGEQLSSLQTAGLVIAAAGTAMVQWRARQKAVLTTEEAAT